MIVIHPSKFFRVEVVVGAAVLAACAEEEWSPVWSPDGQKIAFVSGYEIYVMDTDPSTNDATNITNNRRTDDYGPDWSPSGGKIAFERSGFRNSEIYVMNKDGSGQKRLTDSIRDDYSPDWQPIVP